MAYQSKYKGKEVEDILDNALQRKEQILSDDEKKQVKQNLGIKDLDLSSYATKKDVKDAISKIPTPDVEDQISAALVDYVKKVEGKGLSTNDFTNELKKKLEGITPYDPSELEAEIDKLEKALNTLVSSNFSNAIESFNEIVAFLQNVSDKETLSEIIAGVNAYIAEVEGKIPTKTSELKNDSGFITEHQDISNLATKEELKNKVDKVSGKQLSTEDFTSVLKAKLEGLNNYDDTTLSNAISTLRGDFDKLISGDTTTAIKTFNEVIAFLDGISDSEDLDSIIASIEQQIASKYSKPNNGIPKSDLANNIQLSLDKADTALQEHQSLANYATKQYVTDTIQLAITNALNTEV